MGLTVATWCCSLLSGVYAGAAFVSLVFCSLFALVSLLSSSWTLRAPASTDQCPFPADDVLSTRVAARKTEARQPAVVGREESCEWLNLLLRVLFFASAESPLAARFQRHLLTRLRNRLEGLQVEFAPYLSLVRLEQFRVARKAPTIGSIQILPNAHGGFDLALGYEYRGEVALGVSGSVGLGVGPLSSRLGIKATTGAKLYCKFERVPSPRLSLMLSGLPNFSLAVERAGSPLGRISDLLGLIVSSLLRTHTVFPNFQLILLRPEADLMRDTLIMPVWRSSRRFVRLELRSVTLSEAVVASLEGNGPNSNPSPSPSPSLSLTITIGKYRAKTENFRAAALVAPLKLSLHCSLNDARDGGRANKHDDADETLPTICVQLMQKRKKFAKKVPIFSANLPLDCVPTNVPHTMGLYAEEDSAHGCRVNIEILYSTEKMKVDSNGDARAAKRTWPLVEELPREPTAADTEFLNGMDWKNIKMAWRRFRKSSVAAGKSSPFTELQLQIEELIESLAADASLGELAGDGEQPGALKSSLESLAQELEAIVPATGDAEGAADEIIATHYPKIMKTFDEARAQGVLDLQIEGEMRNLDRSLTSLKSQGSIRSTGSTAELDDPPLHKIVVEDSFELLLREGDGKEALIDGRVGQMSVRLALAQGRLACSLSATAPSGPIPLKAVIRGVPKGEVEMTLGPTLLSIVGTGHSSSTVLLVRLEHVGEMRLLSQPRGSNNDSWEVEIASSTMKEVLRLGLDRVGVASLLSFCIGISGGDKGYQHEFGLEDCCYTNLSIGSSGDFNINANTNTNANIDSDSDADAEEGLVHLLSFAYREEGTRAVPVIVPIAERDLPAARNIRERLSFHATLTAAASPMAFFLPLPVAPDEPKGRGEQFHREIMQHLGYCLRESEVALLTKCYLKKKLPLPGYLAVTQYGVLFTSRISDRKIFVRKENISSLERLVKWHAKGLCVTSTDGTAYEFMQMSEDSLSLAEEWCLESGAPWKG